jgi:hypothetical protein
MKRKLMIVAACAATALLSSGIAHADPAPGPDPNGPKCWVTNADGHQQLTPCGWAYTDERGWYEVPPGFMAIP